MDHTLNRSKLHVANPNGAARRTIARRIGIFGPHMPGSVHSRLRDWLLKTTALEFLVWIGNPLLDKTIGPRFTLLRVRDSTENQLIKYHREPLFWPLSALLDIFLPLVILISRRKKMDVAICSGLQFAILGLILRKLRIVKTMVFWTVDYFPQRFKSRLINRVYQILDDVCVIDSDFVWEVTKLIGQDRKRRGHRLPDTKRILVPVTFESSEIEKGSSRNKCDLVYVGNLNPSWGFGFDLIIEAVRNVCKEISDVHVKVISYSEVPKVYIDKIKGYGLSEKFTFLGQVSDEMLRSVLLSSRIGLAPYSPDFIASTKRFADPSRVKTYLSKGLPVIVTKGLPISDEVSYFHAGIAIEYTVGDLTDAILKLLKNQETYDVFATNATTLASTYDSYKIYREAFNRMGLKLQFIDGTS